MSDALYDLTTQYEEGVGKYNKLHGAMFHVKSTKKERITITSLDINTITEKYINCEVRYRLGKIKVEYLHSFDGGWNLVANTTIIGNGVGVETIIPNEEFQPVTLNPGEDATFWINLDKPELLLIEFASLATNDIFSLNSDMEVQVGLGVVETHLTPNVKRNQVWSGTIWYIVDHNEENTKYDNKETEELTGKSSQLITDIPETRMTYGTMFDIRAHKDMIIKSIDFHTSVLNELVAVDVWTKAEQEDIITEPNSFNKPKSWTRLARVSVKGMGRHAATSIPSDKFISIKVQHGSVQRFYITLHTPKLICGEASRLYLGDIFGDNDDLSICVGAAVDEYLNDLSKTNGIMDNASSSTASVPGAIHLFSTKRNLASQTEIDARISTALVHKVGFNGIIRYDVLNDDTNNIINTFMVGITLITIVIFIIIFVIYSIQSTKNNKNTKLGKTKDVPGMQNYYHTKDIRNLVKKNSRKDRSQFSDGHHVRV